MVSFSKYVITCIYSKITMMRYTLHRTNCTYSNNNFIYYSHRYHNFFSHRAKTSAMTNRKIAKLNPSINIEEKVNRCVIFTSCDNWIRFYINRFIFIFVSAIVAGSISFSKLYTWSSLFDSLDWFVKKNDSTLCSFHSTYRKPLKKSSLHEYGNNVVNTAGGYICKSDRG